LNTSQRPKIEYTEIVSQISSKCNDQTINVLNLLPTQEIM